MIDFTGLGQSLRLDALLTHLMGIKQKQRGDGWHRAQKRLREKRAANALIPSNERPTRQRDRYIRRALAKKGRIEDMRNYRKTPGGPAMRPSWREYYAPA